jgi:hypothetical protein
MMPTTAMLTITNNDADNDTDKNDVDNNNRKPGDADKYDADNNKPDASDTDNNALTTMRQTLMILTTMS